MTGRVIAFYGFKGGAGRSFLLASTAALLAALGRRVLVIDADMEAPGLGDFFDSNVQSHDLETGPLFSESRLKDGFLDLMTEIASPDFVMNNASTLTDAIAERLDPARKDGDSGRHRYMTEVGPFHSVKGVKQGHLYLMGAGSHRVTSEDGSFNYIARLLDFDWTAKVQGRGKFAFDALGEVLADGALFDDVLIDGRTGYNPASIVAIRNLATDVVMVGTSSMQSIDGMARMRTLFSSPDGETDGLRTHMVMSKMSGALPDEAHRARRLRAAEVKRELNGHYHPENTFHDLPYVEDFVTGDTLLFRRSGLRDIAPDADDGRLLDPSLLPEARTKVAVALYKHRLLCFVRDLLGPDGLGSGYPSIDAAALDTAFQSWSADQGQQTGMRSGFESTIAAPGAAEITADSRFRIDEMYESVERYVSPRKERDDPQQRSAEEHGGRDGSAALKNLKRQFAALRLEERALVQARVIEHLTDEHVDRQASAVTDVYDALRLAVSPNIVRRAQLKALGLLDAAPTSSFAETRSETSGGSLDQTANQAQLTKLCALILDKSEANEPATRQRFAGDMQRDIERELGRTRDPEYRSILQFLDRFLAAILGPEDAREARRREANEAAAELLKAGNPYLPKDLVALREYNILDLIKRLVNLRGEMTAPSASAVARLAIRWLGALTDAFADASVSEQGNLIQDFANWSGLWAANAMNGVGFADPKPANYPSRDDLALAIGLMDGAVAAAGAELDIETINFTLAACQALASTATILDDAPRAHAALERATDLAAGASMQLTSGFGEHLQALMRTAAAIGRTDLNWRLARLDDVLRSRRSDSKMDGTFDFPAYLTLLRAGQDVGLALHDGRIAFPDLPDQVIASDRKTIADRYGWWRDADAVKFGEYRRYVDACRGEKDADNPEAGKLGFLVTAEVETGAIEPAMMSFERWRTLASRQRNGHVDGVAVFSNITCTLLRGLLHAGDADSFETLLRRTEHIVPAIEVESGKTHFVRRRLLELRHAAATGALRGGEAAAQALDLLAQGLAIARRLPSPTDAALPPLLGDRWDNFGAFAGDEAPSPVRAIVASLILDALELAPEPLPDHLLLVEQLVWGHGARFHGEALTPVGNAFVGRLEPRLRLERARLECQRARHGLAADLGMAGAAMHADLALNGAGRAIYYPQALRQDRP